MKPLLFSVLTFCLVSVISAQGFGGKLEREQGKGRLQQKELKNVPEVLRHALKNFRRQRFIAEGKLSMRGAGSEKIITPKVIFDRGNFRIEGDTLVVQFGKERRMFDSRTNEILVVDAHEENPVTQILRLARRNLGSKFALLPSETVAGYVAETVSLSDKNGNLLAQVFIEPKSGIVLKQEIFDANGTKRNLREFTKIQINPPEINSSVFSLDRKGATVLYPLDILRRRAKESDVPIFVLEKSTGFRLGTSRSQSIQGRSFLVQIYRQKDRMLTLFVLKKGVDRSRLANLVRGKLSQHVFERDGYTLVLVGEGTNEALKELSSKIVRI